MFAIRCYNCENLDEVVTLWYRSWTHTFPNLNHPQPFKEWKSRLQNEYAPSDVWVATTKERIVGFLVAKDGVISQIFVDVDIQRSGVGTTLLNQAKKIYPDGLKLTTLEQNVNARQFYEKHGFVPGLRGINPINEQSNIEYCWNP
ncbi:putative acetyltransferase [Dulcicalothrix desertica PCC 7102]|nr:putative acetyltransferase [Dulcicalothrix desertica PCC 7102]